MQALGEKADGGDGGAELVRDAGDEVGLQGGKLLLLAEGEEDEEAGEGSEDCGRDENQFETQEALGDVGSYPKGVNCEFELKTTKTRDGLAADCFCPRNWF